MREWKNDFENITTVLEETVSEKQQRKIIWQNYYRRQCRFFNVVVININDIEFLTLAPHHTTRPPTPQRNSISMDRLKCWTSLVILVVSLCHFYNSEACSCVFKHPQAHFCDSEFVTVVNVTNLTSINYDEFLYTVEVLTILKATQDTRIALEQKFIWLSSISMDSECPPLNLTSGMILVLSGIMLDNTLLTSPCGFAEQWSMLSHNQRKGFDGLYHRGCACSISDGKLDHEGALESVDEKRCLWEISPGPRDCQEQFSICMPSSAGCSWVNSYNYKSCIAYHERFRVQQQLHQHP